MVNSDTINDDLAAAETRLRTKWFAAMEARGAALPTEPYNASDWKIGEPPPATLQFPRQQWANYPAGRRVVLALCDRMLDFADQLTDQQWAALNFLIQYGGRTPL